MQAGQIVSVDASASQPVEISKKDPRHLNNLTSSITRLNAQSSADTKYDPKPPPRVDASGNEVKEPFMAPIGASDTQLTAGLMYGFGGMSAIVLVMAVFSFIDPSMYAFIRRMRYGVEMLVISTLICLLNMTIIYFALRRNEIIQWYPALTR